MMNLRAKCLMCNEREATNLKRQICAHCYSDLYRYHQLPAITNEATLSFRKANLIAKHGEAIIDDLNHTANIDSDFTLSDLSAKYGFTREYARQIFFGINGFQFTVIKKVRIAKDRERKLKLLRSPSEKLKRYTEGSLQYNGAIAEDKAVNICNRLGFSVTINREDGQTIDMVVNGLRCEVKASYRPTKTRNNGHYYHFGLSKEQLEKVDFILCYVAPKSCFYVIPRSEITSSIIWIPSNSETQLKSRYNQFKEAWHLLKPEDIRLGQGAVN